MELSNIKFAPIKVPLRRRVETFVTCWTFLSLILGGYFWLCVTIYLILFTKLWWITLIYVLWIILWDFKTPELGGRPINWFRNLKWWYYVKEYFPVRMERLPWVELNPKKNYLFCCFPHGMMAFGLFGNTSSNYGEFKIYFPKHSVRAVSLNSHFYMPFHREIALALGGISANAKSMEYVLNQPNGGYVCALVPGGAQESYYCKPGQYKIILKNRKGFIKVALKTGTPVVPVISFGETDTYDQIEGDTLHKVQEFLRKWIIIAPVIPIGRGFFQYNFGLIPRRKRIVSLVGVPMEVPKIENPTCQQVDQYHSQFMEQLAKMFEEQKHNYVEDPENTKLIIT